jgi:hypothetical protein
VPRYGERRWPKITAAYAVFVLVLAAITALADQAVADENRAMVVRLAVVVLAAVGLVHLRSYFRGDPLWDPPSEFADALSEERLDVKIDPGFVKLRDQVAHSLASRSFFEDMLRPRLRGLAGIPLGDEDPARPSFWHRVGRRGASPEEIGALIDRIEEGKRK